MQTSEGQTNNALSALSDEIAAAVERASESIVAIDARPRVMTSGVVWRENTIVSTNHTIRRDDDITVALPDGQTVGATLVGRDPGTDLAVLRVEDQAAASLKAAEIGDAAELKVGNLVLAVGRTTNAEHAGATASLGIISAVGDAWRSWRGDEIDRLINLDLAIRLGFSGGALINAEGRVLGVNTSAFGRGAAITIPASTVSRVVDQLLNKGRIARPFLGVGTQAVAISETLRSKLNLSQTSGLIMLSIESNGPAEQAGILLGDVLLEIDETATTETSSVQTALANREPGQAVNAKILRGGEIQVLAITLGERPAQKRRRR